VAEVGNATIPVFPTFKGFRSAVTSEVDGAGKESASRFGRIFSSASSSAGQSSGRAFSSAFSTGAGNVGADSAKKLQASVASASKALSTARLQEQDAAGKVRVAEAALADARAKGEAGSARLVAAEERLEAAKRKLTTAQDKTKASSESLQTSQKQLADATQEVGTSSEVASSRFARGWDGLKGKLNISKAVKDEADDAVRVSDSGGRESGNAFVSGIKKAMGALAAVFAVDQAVAFFKSSITSAAELEQSVGAVSAIFKDSSGQINAWASSAATDVGLTKNEYNELGTLIGAQLKNGGTAMEELAPKTNDLIGLGADLASMFGGTTSDAVGALSSALKGERDPIEKYGVSLSQAKIDAEAAALGFERVDGALSSQAQQAATLSLVMKQTADSQGNFARESNTLAGQQQRLNSLWGNAKSSLGTAFLPAITAVTTALVNGFPKAEAAVTGTVKRIGLGFTGLRDLFGKGEFTSAFREAFGVEEDSGVVDTLFRIREGFITALGPIGTIVRTVIDTVTSAFQSLGPQVLGLLPMLSPFGLVFQALLPVLPQIAGMIQALAAQLGPVLGVTLAQVTPLFSQLVGILSGVLVALLPTIGTLVTMVGQAFTTLVPVILGVITAVLPLITTLVGQLAPILLNLVTAILPPVVAIFGALIGAIAPLITQIAGLLIPIIQALLPVVVTVFQVIATVITAAMQIIQGIIQVVTGLITGNWSQVWDGIQNIVEGALNTIVAIIAGILAIVGSIVVAGLNAVKGIWNSVWNGIVSFVQSVPGRVTAGLAMLGSLGRIIGGYVEDARSAAVGKFTDLVSFVMGVPGKITGALGNLGGLLVNSGRSLMQGFLDGITGMIGNITSAVGSAMDRVREFFPFSPAKRGPFSGRGYTTYSGKALVNDFADAIEGQAGRVQQAAARVTGAAALSGSSSVRSVPSAGGPGVAGVQVNFNGPVYGNPEHIVDEFKTEVRRGVTLNDLRRVARVG
jgi:phage-related protein